MLLQVETIGKHFGAEEVLRGVSLSVDEGEIVCLLGPSGCGKSTLLRVIAGLESDYTGIVRFAGEDIDRVPVHERGFGFMFQDFALLPHRTVGQNIAFGLRMQRLARSDIARRVGEMLDLVGLTGYESRTIFELSGGERQRVALARSLAPQPRLLMLDEPLGALDRTLRERLTDELRSIIKSVGLTSIYVTHDQVEAFAVADRVALMERGRIVQIDTPLAMYQRPATVFAAQFLGLNNVVTGRQLTHDERDPRGTRPGLWMDTPLGPLFIAGQVGAQREAGSVLIRPEAAEMPTGDAINVVEGEIVRTAFRGGTQRVVLRHASGTILELDLPAGSAPEGGRLRVALRPAAITIIDSE